MMERMMALAQPLVSLGGRTNHQDSNQASFPIAVMEFSTDFSAPSGNAAGGSFHFDTGDDKLYIRVS